MSCAAAECSCTAAATSACIRTRSKRSAASCAPMCSADCAYAERGLGLRTVDQWKLYSYVAHSPAASSGHSSKSHAVFECGTGSRPPKAAAPSLLSFIRWAILLWVCARHRSRKSATRCSLQTTTLFPFRVSSPPSQWCDSFHCGTAASSSRNAGFCWCFPYRIWRRL